MINLEGPRQPPKNGEPAKALAILLHGYGADGNDLIGLAPVLSSQLPHVEFISPHAPFPAKCRHLVANGLVWETDRQMRCWVGPEWPLKYSMIS